MSLDVMPKKIVIGVIAHKEYAMPSNPIYVPIEVGASSREHHFFVNRDDMGENISAKNPSFCELTGYYYAYKNLSSDIMGFVHYRRLFIKDGLFKKKALANVLDESDIEKKLSKVDFILPKKRHYYIENNYHHYCHAHKSEALDKTSEIIKNDYPDYYPYFVKHMKKKSGHYFNMFIAKKELVDGYLNWLFDILFKLEKEINLDEYKGYDKRVFGFVSELLLDVYINKNNYSFINQKYMFAEKQNWFKKIFKFLKRCFSNNVDTSKQ